MPLVLGLGGAALWLAVQGSRGGSRWAATVVTAGLHYELPDWFGLSKLTVSDYKAIAYARKFPTPPASTAAFAVRRFRSPARICISRRDFPTTPPSISKEVPENSYLGLYIDGEGRAG